MDEELMDLLDMALAERFQLSFSAMQQEEPQLQELIAQLTKLSENVQNSPAIGQKDKKMIDNYLSMGADLEVKFQKHLYIQGAKDCVAVLRELGVIK